MFMRQSDSSSVNSNMCLCSSHVPRRCVGKDVVSLVLSFSAPNVVFLSFQ